LATEWDGTGVDTDLVDPVRLQALWSSSGTPDFRTSPLLQSVWLSSEHTQPG
jgi:hypothetical protein